MILENEPSEPTCTVSQSNSTRFSNHSPLTIHLSKLSSLSSPRDVIFDTFAQSVLKRLHLGHTMSGPPPKRAAAEATAPKSKRAAPAGPPPKSSVAPPPKSSVAPKAPAAKPATTPASGPPKKVNTGPPPRAAAPTPKPATAAAAPAPPASKNGSAGKRKSQAPTSVANKKINIIGGAETKVCRLRTSIRFVPRSVVSSSHRAIRDCERSDCANDLVCSSCARPCARRVCSW